MLSTLVASVYMRSPLSRYVQKWGPQLCSWLITCSHGCSVRVYISKANTMDDPAGLGTQPTSPQALYSLYSLYSLWARAPGPQIWGPRALGPQIWGPRPRIWGPRPRIWGLSPPEPVWPIWARPAQNDPFQRALQQASEPVLHGPGRTGPVRTVPYHPIYTHMSA